MRQAETTGLIGRLCLSSSSMASSSDDKWYQRHIDIEGKTNHRWERRIDKGNPSCKSQRPHFTNIVHCWCPRENLREIKRLSTLPAFINTTEKCAEGCPGEMRPLSAGCGETSLPVSGCRAVQGAVLSQPVILPEQLSRTKRKLECCSYHLETSSSWANNQINKHRLLRGENKSFAVRAEVWNMQRKRGKTFLDREGKKVGRSAC